MTIEFLQFSDFPVLIGGPTYSGTLLYVAPHGRVVEVSVWAGASAPANVFAFANAPTRTEFVTTFSLATLIEVSDLAG